MKNLIIIAFLSLIKFSGLAQSYFDEIVEKHLNFFFSEDSVIISNERTIQIMHDSLLIVNEYGEISRKYWETDTSGKIINIYMDISESKLFVIQGLDTKNREYFLYRKKGRKKILLLTWIEDGSEKRKQIIHRPSSTSAHLFVDSLLW